MEKENLERLVFNLNSAIEGHPMFHNIRNPLYAQFYYEIFINEAEKRKHNPVESEILIKEISPLLNKEHPNAKKEINNFMQT